MPVPTAQAIEFISPPLSGVLTAKAFLAGSDTVVATALSVVQAPNRLCVYTVSFNYPDMGASDTPYLVIIYSDGIPVATKHFWVRANHLNPGFVTSVCLSSDNLVSGVIPYAIEESSVAVWNAAEVAGVPATVWGKLRRHINSWFFTKDRNRSNTSEIVETDYASNGTTPLVSRFQTTTDDVDTVTVGNPVAP